MNNQSPLIPQGSLLEQKNKGRARVRIAVFLVLAIHGIGLMALLMQGCKREPDTANNAASNAALSEPTNAAPAFIEPTNSPSLAATNALPPASNTVFTPTPVEPQQPAPTPPAAAASDYVIVKGDTFSTIAKKFHVPTKSLLEANPAVEPTKLKIGQTIHIPAAISTALAMTGTIAAPLADAGTGHMYSVKSGDSLTRIASEFGVTIKALRSENNLKTDKIVVGQKLRIPGKLSTTSASVSPAPTSTSSGQ